MFSGLPQSKTPWSEFVVSCTAQILAIVFLVWLSLLSPEILQPRVRDTRAIELVPTPVPVNHAPQPINPKLLPKPELIARLDPEAIRLPAAQPRPKIKVEDAPVPEVSVAPKKLDSLPPVATVIPKQAVKTNVFSTGSSAMPTIAARAPQQVQTGGFGDPNGVPAKATEGRQINIAQAGGFDMPTGAGVGNGTGGAKGVRGVIASSGFGGGVATGESHGRVAINGGVQKSGFGDADVPAPPTVRSRPAESAAAKMTPAEILSKPTPIYTSEARSMKIEGEVLLEVVLQSSGSVHVVRVVRGLGHGLDDEAVREAEQIRFKPALRDGQPSDSTVVLHFVFQLA
jgi:TonB family protein